MGGCREGSEYQGRMTMRPAKCAATAPRPGPIRSSGRNTFLVPRNPIEAVFALDETRFPYRELNERRLNQRPMSDPDTLMQGGAGGSSQISSDLCPSKATNTAAISAKAVMSLDTFAGSRSGSGRTRGMSPAASRSRWESATTAVRSTGPRKPKRSSKPRFGGSM